jgi:hypothetical protein
VSAVLPDSGWYWNKSESGRGFNIEIQNNVLFMSAFVYDQQGTPIWLVTGGPMSSATAFAGDVYQTTGGQCLGCPYSGPPQSSKYGTATIVFTGPLTATITINGVAVNVERQQFGLDFTNTATPLLGEWAEVSGSTSFPVYFGERIALSMTLTVSGKLTAGGNRAGATSRPALGRFEPTLNQWILLLDSSTSYYRGYTFSFIGLNRIEGEMFLYEKTAEPTTSTYFLAERIKSGAAAAGQNAPGFGKSLSIEAEAAQAAQDLKEASQQRTTGKAASMTLVESFRQLDAALRALSH